MTCLYFSHRTIVVAVRRDDDVDVLDDALERLIELLLAELQLEKRAIHLVHEEYRLDALSDRLTKHSLGLYTNA